MLEVDSAPPVDVFPFLKAIPDRFLGNWRSKANQLNRMEEAFYTKLIHHVVKRRETLGNRDTFVDRALQDEKSDISTHRLAFLASGMVEAGTDTSAIMFCCFLQAMTKWPEVQHEAQKEIDAVVGVDRMPNWSDYDNLPYVTAILKECMRWRPVLPVGLPHFLDQGKLLFFFLII
jgi:cytochrome P450 family 619